MEPVEGRVDNGSAPPRDKVYVAVGRQVKLNQKNLDWALQQFRGADFFILHIHKPSPTMPSPMGGKMPCSSASEEKVEVFRKEERKKMEEAIQRYMAICAAHKVNVNRLELESTDVSEGIVDLVSEHDIKILVMGAAADSKFDKKMSKPTSRKACYVDAHALSSCRIWFICKGNIIYTREVLTSHNQTRIAPGRIQSEKMKQPPTHGQNMFKQFFSFPANKGQSLSQAVAVPQLGRGGSGASSIFSSDSVGTSEWSAPAEESDYGVDVDDGGVDGELKRVVSELSSKIAELQERNDELEKANTSLIAELKNRNDELEKENTLRAQLEEILKRKSNQATILSTENLAPRQHVTKLTGPLQKKNNFLRFNLDELKDATDGFAQGTEIGHGGFGKVYKGKLRHTTVAIKKLNQESACAETFDQEIQALTRVRHPNLVALIGACPEERCLVYEFVKHGDLEHHLFDPNSKSLLSCKDRLRIAAEICSALLFLHSVDPDPIVHGDLKPANILLDANNKAKIADFGICRFLPEVQRDSGETIFRLTDPKGTNMYMDPQFMATNELTFKSDVYAFGIILLQLLTGKKAFGLVKMVKTALDKGELSLILDPNVGEWNVTDAADVSDVALQCCEADRKNRPNLKGHVWELLERYLE